MNRIFFDTEFYENGETINFLSIGCIKEDGQQLYLVNRDFDYDWMVEDCKARGNLETIDFLNKNVFNQLNSTPQNTFSMKGIKNILMDYIGVNPILWTSTGSYDWVMVMQTFFGIMVHKPKDWPYMQMDTNQLKNMFPQVKKDLSLFPFSWPKEGEHNALFDACEVYAKYLSYKKFITENNLPITI